MPSNKNSNKNSRLTLNKQFKRAHAKSPIKDTQLILFNKPFNTLCQFTGETGDITLANFIYIPHVYPAGRLDKDSEGLLVLTNDGNLQHKISHPKHKMEKTYLVQIEGSIDSNAISNLCKGVKLKDGVTKPAKAKVIDIEKYSIKLWDRNPPIRQRKNIPTSWIELKIKEGKNRQVRRMTAAIGYPTLRLIRYSIGDWTLKDLKPGEFRNIKVG